jgi:polar amino acid transport system substrate-binding protein
MEMQVGILYAAPMTNNYNGWGFDRQGSGCGVSRLFCLTLLGVILSIAPTSRVAAEELALRVAASAWPPYAGERLPQEGLAMHLVTAGLARAGYRTTTTIGPWPRVLSGTRAGEYDVIAGAWLSREREEELSFSDPFLTNEIKLIRKRGNDIGFEDVASLAGRRIAVVEDYAYGKEFSRATNITEVVLPSVLESIRAVISGSVDLALADERVAWYVLNTRLPGGYREVEFLSPPVTSRGLRIAVSKRNPHHEEIARDFDRAIAAMRQDGSFSEILTQHRFSH